MAETEGVDVRLYNIIYRLVDDINLALKGMLEPTFREVTIGRAEVRDIFHLPNKRKVAGCGVTSGLAARNALVRVLREGKVIFESRVASLKRFKEDVREVAAGMDCGVGVEGFGDFQLGDTIEFYRKEQVSQAAAQ
jgi:translation initiation factor IF-2